MPSMFGVKSTEDEQDVINAIDCLKSDGGCRNNAHADCARCWWPAS